MNNCTHINEVLYIGKSWTYLNHSLFSSLAELLNMAVDRNLEVIL
jgi:hypothetical protein